MSEPLISILIRHSWNRVQLLERCLKSIFEQEYKNWFVIISIEDNRPSPFVHYNIGIDLVPKQHFNLHCNNLKSWVNEGFFMYCDDDDYLAPGSLKKLADHLTEPAAYIVQFLRNGRPKPLMDQMRKRIIQKGYIGGGCLVLHHSFKDVANWKGKVAADYDYIKEVTDKVKTIWVPMVLQITDRKSNGK